MARGFLWAAALFMTSVGPAAAQPADAPTRVTIGWSELQPAISMRAGTRKLDVDYNLGNRVFVAKAPSGTTEILVDVYYPPQGARGPDSYRLRLVPREPTISFSVPRPPPLARCNAAAYDRIGQGQPNYQAAFWLALEARELLRRPISASGFCGRTMRQRIESAFQARQRDVERNYDNIRLPLFVDGL